MKGVLRRIDKISAAFDRKGRFRLRYYLECGHTKLASLFAKDVPKKSWCRRCKGENDGRNRGTQNRDRGNRDSRI